MDDRWRTTRIEAAHEAVARRHPYWTLYGRTWVRWGGAVGALAILAHWVGIL